MNYDDMEEKQKRAIVEAADAYIKDLDGIGPAYWSHVQKQLVKAFQPPSLLPTKRQLLAAWDASRGVGGLSLLPRWEGIGALYLKAAKLAASRSGGVSGAVEAIVRLEEELQGKEYGRPKGDDNEG